MPAIDRYPPKVHSFFKHDPESVPIFEYCSKEGLIDSDIIYVDVGCQKGIRKKWRHIENKSKFYGFDPVEEEIDQLKKYRTSTSGTFFIPKNSSWNAIALGKEDGSCKIYTHPGKTQYSGMDRDFTKNSVSQTLGEEFAERISERIVPVRSIDSFFKDEGIDYIDYLKVDVENAELEVLEGAIKYFSEGKIKCVEIEHPLRHEISYFFDKYNFYLRDAYIQIVPESPADLGALELSGKGVYLSNPSFGRMVFSDGLYLSNNEGFDSLGECVKYICVLELCFAPDLIWKTLKLNENFFKYDHLKNIYSILGGMLISNGTIEQYEHVKAHVLKK